MNHSGNQYDETIPLVRDDMRDNGNRRRVDVEDKKVSGEQARQHGMRTVFGTSCTRWDDHTGSSSLTLSTDKNDDCMSLISGENGLKSSALLSTPSMATGVSHYRGILTAGKRWWSISKLWFISEDRYKARAYAGSAVLLSILTTLLLLKISDVQSGFSSALVCYGCIFQMYDMSTVLFVFLSSKKWMCQDGKVWSGRSTGIQTLFSNKYFFKSHFDV